MRAAPRQGAPCLTPLPSPPMMPIANDLQEGVRMPPAMSSITRRLVLAASGALAACGPGQPGAKRSDRRVHVYSARHYDSDKAVYDLFTREKGIEVRVLPAP